MNAEVLIIDEIGLLSAKVIEEVELICRHLKGNDKIFGGLQVIAAGSFVQLPPVPSLHDNAKYAFESNIFMKIFPHRIMLHQVHRQNQHDLVQSINELCEDKPSKKTHDLMQSLKRPLQHTLDALYIFRTNFEVDFFNAMTLKSVPYPEMTFLAKDYGDVTKLRKCVVPKTLVLKLSCKVIVVRNLDNGLVNGLSGTVTKIEDNQVEILIDTDVHLNHQMQGKKFTVNRYTFLIQDENNSILAKREQLPLKLGYTVTVDKSQGRTLDNVVIDSSNFWRPGQMGVSVGRARSKEGLSFLCYNRYASQMRHPQVVQDLYTQRSFVMKQNMSCCNNCEVDTLVNAFQVDANDVQSVPLGVSNFDYMQNVTITDFPFDPDQYVEDFISKAPKLTGIQMEQLSILRANSGTADFKQFLSNSYSTIHDLFNKCKICEKKRKCNWCRLCAHMHNIFGSQMYRQEMLKAFNLTKLTSNVNAVCTRIYFDFLQIVSSKESSAIITAKLKDFMESQSSSIDLDNLDKSTLRYIGGACLHYVRNSMKKMAIENVYKNDLKSKVMLRIHQLTGQLIGSKTSLENETLEPESLLKLMEKDTGGLLYVTDETFNFFKLLLQRIQPHLNIMTIQMDPQLAYMKAVNYLGMDQDIVRYWLTLFETNSSEQKCTCATEEQMEEQEEMSLSAENMWQDLELDESLLLFRIKY